MGVGRLSSERRITFVPQLPASSYGAIVAQDVLENVEDPIQLASEIAGQCV